MAFQCVFFLKRLQFLTKSRVPFIELASTCLIPPPPTLLLLRWFSFGFLVLLHSLVPHGFTRASVSVYCVSYLPLRLIVIFILYILSQLL